jgi:thioredoxin-related protein
MLNFKKIILSIFLLTGAVFALDWVKDIDTALEIAKKEHKVVMVMVEGEHCRWCKKMKGRTLSDDTVEKRLEKFVVVKVMREDGNAMAKLPTRDVLIGMLLNVWNAPVQNFTIGMDALSKKLEEEA